MSPCIGHATKTPKETLKDEAMKQSSARMPSKRTQLVWGAFFFAIPCALVLLQAGSNDLQGSILLTTIASAEDRPTTDPIFTTIESPKTWSAIVINHLGQPAGTVDSVGRDHQNAGLDGFGYHFLIGNGNGLGDGDVEMGYRWINQTPSAKPTAIDAANWNNGVISICLIGNGNRRPFTEEQMLRLSHLVQRLQKELAIPESQVMLAGTLGDVDSPGQYFAEAQFRSQLFDIPR
ncbi:MAG: hypothetical protein CMJ26_06610 [Phycisphaerae bacterium]|nr:hypothetical protein [Phycisphaerae bacterium]|tara:strand:- start:426 stop:1127 length:702 start_codon:yes stop_codon:yes gene_type:complete